MSYIRPEFFLFFAFVLGVYLVVRGRSPRTALLIAASLAYYACAGLFDLLIFLAVVVFSYCAARLAQAHPRRRGFFLFTAVAALTAHLVFWKYLPWIASGWQTLDPAFMGGRSIALRLPLGISFFTFQGIAYLVDYWRETIVMMGFAEYLLYHSLFSHMIAGPIVRARQLLPQLRELTGPTPEDLGVGAALFARGLVKKMLIADRVAPFVDMVFVSPGKWGREALVWSAIGFAVQLWGDFSGYTDMGRGTARMLGLRLPENFMSPFLCRKPSEFWERWHITLSHWARDYVFWPLRQWALAPFATALLLGLWHGSNWTFLLWGFYLRALFVAEDAVCASPVGRLWSRLPDALRHAALIPLTLTANIAGIVIFRSESLSKLLEYIAALFGGPLNGAASTAFGTTVMLEHFYPAAALALFFEALFYRRLQNREWRPFGACSGANALDSAVRALEARVVAWPAGLVLGAAVAASALAAIFFRQGDAASFIYFSF